MSSSSAPLARLVRLLAGSKRMLIFTGAGVSTASGIPDYRGPKGVWQTRAPVFYDDFLNSDESRREYWQQKLEDRTEWGAATPNETHRAIVALEQAGRVEMVVTQNIDGLHRAAGTSPERLVEVHGTVGEVECQACGRRTEPGPHFDAFAATGEPPRCECGGFLKPATISFGQSLRQEDLMRAFSAAERADLVLALGSTLSVTPAANIPLHAAEGDTPYVIVNRGATDHDRLPVVTLRVEGEVGEVLVPAVAEVLTSQA